MKKFLLIVLAAALAAVSCNKETEALKETPAPVAINHGSQTFTAVREAIIDNATKAVFNDDEMRLDWEVGDSVAISDGNVMSIFDVVEVSADGVATFAIRENETELSGNATYKAWYPVSFAPDADGKCNLAKQVKNDNGETPEGKKINYAPSIYSQNPMYAESTTTELSFKNTCALIKISLVLPEGTADTAFSQIVIESGESQVFGPGTIENNTYVPSAEDASQFVRCAVVNSNAKWHSVVNTYYIALPAQTYESLFFMPQTNTKLVQYFPIGKPLTLERNTYYTLNLTCDDLRTDLSINNAYANCYVTTAASAKVMFKATKGPSDEPIEGIDHVGVVWRAQTYNTTSLTDKIIKNVYYKRGMVCFDTVNNQGNALIAAYDSEGKVLWSWHIWNLNSARPLTDIAMGGHTFLDRNIGALYSDKYASGDFETSILTAGYFFQWGRKDPFPGRGQEGSASVVIKMLDDSNACLNDTADDGRATNPKTIAGPATVQTAIENPAKFITASSGHWTEDAEGTWAGESKTIYDPCPFGYRVPALADFSDAWTTDNVTPYEYLKNATDTSVHGFYWQLGESKMFFPVTGQLSNTTGKLAGGYIGTNSNSASAAVQGYSRVWTRETGHTFVDGVRQIAKGKAWEDRTSVIRTASSLNSYGMAVRCQKIEE